jgi:hypothetical protein
LLILPQSAGALYKFVHNATTAVSKAGLLYDFLKQKGANIEVAMPLAAARDLSARTLQMTLYAAGLRVTWLGDTQPSLFMRWFELHALCA